MFLIFEDFNCLSFETCLWVVYWLCASKMLYMYSISDYMTYTYQIKLYLLPLYSVDCCHFKFYFAHDVEYPLSNLIKRVNYWSIWNDIVFKILCWTHHPGSFLFKMKRECEGKSSVYGRFKTAKLFIWSFQNLTWFQNGLAISKPNWSKLLKLSSSTVPLTLKNFTCRQLVTSAALVSYEVRLCLLF